MLRRGEGDCSPSLPWGLLALGVDTDRGEVGAPLHSALGDFSRKDSLPQDGGHILIGLALNGGADLDEVGAGEAVTLGVLVDEVNDGGADTLVLGLLGSGLAFGSRLLVESGDHGGQLLGNISGQVAVVDAVGQSLAVGHLGSSHGIKPFLVVGHDPKFFYLQEISLSCLHPYYSTLCAVCQDFF